ncbi:MAG: hypothetical protein ACO25K_06255 [Candidatus Fonsibacter ubiquis]
MKVNLLINQKHLAKNGYLNIDPTATKEDYPLIVEGNPTILEQHLEDNEAEEIIAMNVIDYVSYNKIDSVLTQWISKLAHKGLLKIGFTDIVSVARRIYTGQIEYGKAQEIIYGKCVEGWDVKKACLTVDSVKEKFNNLGLSIKNIKFIEHYVVIEGERP